jgi:hypothetical protein
MFRLLGVTLALCASASAFAQSSTAISAKNPALFVRQLEEMGFKTRDLDLENAFPTLVLEKDEAPLTLTFGGCEALFHLNCSYVVAVGLFDDVKDPPADWVAKQNADFDMIKVWRTDDNILAFSNGAIIEGWPRQTFIAWIDSINRASDELAKEAVDAGLVKNQSSPVPAPHTKAGKDRSR